MSGGSYEYVSMKMDDAADTLRGRHSSEPHVVALANRLAEFAAVMHEIEWADSCDTSWSDQLDANIRALLAPGDELRVARMDAEDAARRLAAVLARVQDTGSHP